MKIAFIVPAPAGKGVYWRGFHLAKSITALGHRVRLVCYDQNINRPRWNIVNGVEQVLLPTSNVLYKWFFWQVVNSNLNIFLSKSFEPDIIHIFATVAPSSALSAIYFNFSRNFTLSNTKILLDWDDLWIEGKEGILRDYDAFVKTVGGILEKKTLMFGDAVTVVSDFLMSKAHSLGIKSVYKIPNGCNVDGIKPLNKIHARKRLGLPLHKLILVHVGFTDLTETFSILREHYPDALLIVVGASPRYVALRIPKLRHVEGIMYAGSQPYERIPLYLAAADILILKQENELTEVARWPIRFGDYLASGRPIVTGKLGEVGRIVSDAKCGLLAEPGNQKDLARAILELLEKPDQWEVMGRRARGTAEKFSWINVARRLERVYSGLIKNYRKQK
jgi:glycosyltransferase involved in cell wall biosynthesis